MVMAPLKELLQECRDDFMPLLVASIEGDRDVEWLGTCMLSDDFDVIIRSNFVLLPAKLLIQRLTEAAAAEDHKKVFQGEKAAAYVEKLGKWLDNYNKDQKAEAEKEIEETREFVTMLINAAEGDRDLEWLGAYILSEDFDVAIRSGFVLLPAATVLKGLAEIANDDQKKALQTEKAAAYVTKFGKWIDDYNKAEKAAAAAAIAAQLGTPEAPVAAPAAAPAPAPQEVVQAK